MTQDQQSLETLKDIRTMMDRSSRFISLSGWSGVAAGCCALAGAWFANGIVSSNRVIQSSLQNTVDHHVVGSRAQLVFQEEDVQLLLIIALVTLLSAIIAASFFTWLRSRKTSLPIWGNSSKRMLFALSLPLAVGGIYMLQLLQAGAFGMIAPGCLFFYGLGLVSASRYTYGEIRWLGYAQIIIGLFNLAFIEYGLYCLAFGFGVLHIVYGLGMWYRHERNEINQ